MTKSRRLPTILAMALAVGLGMGISACNTVEGIGKDISAAGRALGADGNRQN